MSSLRERWAGVSVLVVGDLMLDRYLEGAVRRISPEAPVPVVSLQREWECPGGAGNVAASIAGLGADVTCAGVVGRDESGARLRHLLGAMGVKDLALVERDGVQTVTKTRVLAPDHHQLLRLDVDGHRPAYEEAAQELIATLVPQIGRHQAVCLADYEKGALPVPVVRAVIDAARRQGVPCLVDPKKEDFSAYAGATVVTPNLAEAERAVGRPLGSADDVAEAALELRQRLNLDWTLITRGPDGMSLAGRDGVSHFPAEVREVADVTGAGDTVIATLSTCLGSGWDMAEACRLAGVAAGLAVSKPGAYVVRAAELEKACTGGSYKVVDWDTAVARARDHRRGARRVVFTNGCFDLLHAGHLHCLEQARRLGDVLVVGLNSDASVKMLKGPERPVIGEAQRAALLAGLACVDLVVLFDELTPESLIRDLEPDVLVKGGDYDPATIVGADLVRARGGRVVAVPVVKGLSTTAILQRTKPR
jgi:D-beta-D-heptose 7-phosphate kinase/D-beta-D-heptose 1-phosphate adenosyltransferase